MLKVFRLMLLITCGLFVADGMAAATEAARAEEMTLRRIEAKGAVIVLRSILGLRQLEVVDAQTIRVQDSPANVLLARKVVELVERADDAPNADSTFEVGDGTVVARAILRHAPSRDVMVALRSLGISRMATVGEPSAVIVRDSAEQVVLAMDRIRFLDRDVP